MPIDIRSISNISPGSSTKKTAAQNGTTAQPKTALSAQDTDSVSLTDTVSVLKAAQELLASVPIINSEHVSMVTDAVNNGSYEIDSEEVAEKIIESEQNHPI